MKSKERAADVEAEALAVHRAAVVVDTVNRSKLDDRFLRDVRTGGVTLLGRTILVSSGEVFSPFGFMESVRDIAHVLQFIDQHADQVMLVKTARDIERAKAANRAGIYLYFQSPEPLEKELWRLRLFYELGLRVLQLSYNDRSLAGDGCAERTDTGLSDWGVQLIEECNRLGIAVDVSHSGYRTTMEAMELSKAPVLFTHANARALCDNRRCKTDEQVKRCAEKGGVVGVQAASVHQYQARPHEDMLDHVDHYAKLIGVDHVGLGLDLTTGHERDDYSLLGYKPEMYKGVWVDGVQQTVPGMGSLADLPNITAGLLRRGYNAGNVTKILGANFVHVLSKLWRDESSGA